MRSCSRFRCTSRSGGGCIGTGTAARGGEHQVRVFLVERQHIAAEPAARSGRRQRGAVERGDGALVSEQSSVRPLGLAQHAAELPFEAVLVLAEARLLGDQHGAARVLQCSVEIARGRVLRAELGMRRGEQRGVVRGFGELERGGRELERGRLLRGRIRRRLELAPQLKKRQQQRRLTRCRKRSHRIAHALSRAGSTGAPVSCRARSALSVAVASIALAVGASRALSANAARPSNA